MVKCKPWRLFSKGVVFLGRRHQLVQANKTRAGELALTFRRVIRAGVCVHTCFHGVVQGPPATAPRMLGRDKYQAPGTGNQQSRPRVYVLQYQVWELARRPHLPIGPKASPSLRQARPPHKGVNRISSWKTLQCAVQAQSLINMCVVARKHYCSTCARAGLGFFKGLDCHLPREKLKETVMKLSLVKY